VTERSLRAALVVLCLAGAGIAGYVLVVRWGDGQLLCSTGGCETVQSSSYAELLGVPVAALGLAAYLAILGTACFGAAAARMAGAAIALSAAVFSAYLLVVQLVILDAVCTWCLGNDAIVSLVAAAALLRLRGGSHPVLSGFGSSSPSASA
jgi:uncharacterized membrane protein